MLPLILDHSQAKTAAATTAIEENPTRARRPIAGRGRLSRMPQAAPTRMSWARVSVP